MADVYVKSISENDKDKYDKIKFRWRKQIPVEELKRIILRFGLKEISKTTDIKKYID